MTTIDHLDHGPRLPLRPVLADQLNVGDVLATRGRADRVLAVEPCGPGSVRIVTCDADDRRADPPCWHLTVSADCPCWIEERSHAA